MIWIFLLEFVLRQNGGISGNNRDHSISVPFPNGTGRGQSPQMRRAGSGGIMGSSPKGPPRSLGYANVRLGTRELGYQWVHVLESHMNMYMHM